MKALLRSLLGVLGGLVATVGVVMLATLAGVFLLLGGDMEADPTPAWLVVNLGYSFLAAVLGGWLAGRIAGRSPLLHALVLAAVLLLLSAGGGGGASTGAPDWYAEALMGLGAGGAVAGGLLHWARTGSPGKADTAG